MCDQCSSFFTKTQEPYSFLLERREWGAKRLRILARDHYTCKECGAHEGDGVALQVHHLHYIYGLDPWEYKDSELVTLCESCHSKVHSRCEVPVYRLEGDDLVEVHLTPCSRCGGAGWFPEYKHVQGGVCFRCHGAKYDELIDVVENYAEEHDIDINDIDDGFMSLGPEVEGLGTIKEVRICRCRNRDGVYAELVMNTGFIYPCCLDFSVEAEPGDRLDPNKLRYRNAVKKNGQEYTIIKGARLLKPTRKQ